MKLRHTIIIYFLFLYGLLLGLYFFIVHPYIYKEFLNQEEEKINFYTKSVVTSLNSYISLITDEINFISNLEELKTLNISESEKRLSSFVKRYPFISSYSFFDNKQNLIIKKNNKTRPNSNEFILYLKSYVMNNKNIQVGVLQGEFIFDDTNIDKNNWILGAQNHKWRSILTNKKGLLIHHSDIEINKLSIEDRNYSSYPSVKNALLGKWGLTKEKLNGTVWYSASEFIPDVDWIFIVEIPRNIILKNLTRIMLPVNIIVVTILSLIFIFIIIFSGKFIAPLHLLTNTLREYGISGEVKKIETKAASEMSEAITAFNNMVAERDKLEKEVFDISETERHRIGIDLHDDLGQILTGIAFQVVMLEEECKNKTDFDVTYIREVSNLIDEAIKKTKMISRGLYPINLLENGLANAIEELVNDIKKLYNIKCTFRNEPKREIKNDTTIINLFYIIKEATNNAIKHGKAKNIDIMLLQKKYETRLLIKDNGTGFNKKTNASGLGLKTMHYRAKLIHGDFKIESNKKSGTSISCIIKLKSGEQN